MLCRRSACTLLPGNNRGYGNLGYSLLAPGLAEERELTRREPIEHFGGWLPGWHSRHGRSKPVRRLTDNPRPVCIFPPST